MDSPDWGVTHLVAMGQLTGQRPLRCGQIKPFQWNQTGTPSLGPLYPLPGSQALETESHPYLAGTDYTPEFEYLDQNADPNQAVGWAEICSQEGPPQGVSEDCSDPTNSIPRQRVAVMGSA